MPDNNPPEDDRQRGVSTKAVELAVAADILGLGLVAIMDSRRVGAFGWGDDGPQAGYFPFYIGLILCAASAWTLLADTVLRQGHDRRVRQPRKIPAGAVGIHSVPDLRHWQIYFIGIYVASALSSARSCLPCADSRGSRSSRVSLVVPVAVFLLFEVWFLVPLPRGRW